ncbi:probable nucleoside triphosphate pyrophosphatase [Coccomyxa sp. Obi]|nr:probable nucleoside triphosphate pyrophosphatase [Coccomyxa sp. Obi]
MSNDKPLPREQQQRALFQSKPRITLGSASYSRRALLQELSEEYGFDFDILTADIDERGIGDRTRNPETLVSQLASAKAQSLVQQLRGIQQDAMHLLITCDQVVVSSTGTILEKPLDADEARSFIKGYSGSFSSTVGSVLVTNLSNGKEFGAVDTAKIHFDTIPDSVIEHLILEGAVFRCAGGLMIEHPLVAPLITSIEGTRDSVMGLSKELVLEGLLAVAED